MVENFIVISTVTKRAISFIDALTWWVDRIWLDAFINNKRAISFIGALTWRVDRIWLAAHITTNRATSIYWWPTLVSIIGDSQSAASG